MIDLMLVSMALELILLLTVLVYSRGHVLRSFPGRKTENVCWSNCPRVAIIVPLTGNSPEMPAALESLLTQPYPNYETILVTKDPDDTALPLIKELLSRHDRVRHVVSGPAVTCSQKNHNLLAGVKALDDTVEILVFCDSTHEAPSHFLQDLVQPIVTGEKVLTSGFHRIIPGDARVATLGMLQTVLTLHLLHGFAFIALPWGGATAIRRSAFHEYGLAETLKDNVLDDFPLGKRLLQFGIRSTQIPTAIMSTDLAGRNGRGWEMWLFRQMMYLKYCLPTIWLISVLTAWVLVGPVVFAVLAELGGILGLVAPSLALISLGFLLALTVLAAWCRTLVPEPVPLGRWLLSFYASIFVAFWCYLRTWFTDTLAWRGISYRLTWGGRVKEIIISPFFQKQNNLH